MFGNIYNGRSFPLRAFIPPHPTPRESPLTARCKFLPFLMRNFYTGFNIIYVFALQVLIHVYLSFLIQVGWYYISTCFFTSQHIKIKIDNGLFGIFFALIMDQHSPKSFSWTLFSLHKKDMCVSWHCFQVKSHRNIFVLINTAFC